MNIYIPVIFIVNFESIALIFISAIKIIAIRFP